MLLLSKENFEGLKNFIHVSPKTNPKTDHLMLQLLDGKMMTKDNDYLSLYLFFSFFFKMLIIFNKLLINTNKGD